MTVLRSALLLLFVCYCRASGGQCDIDVDRTVSIPYTRTSFIAHFGIIIIVSGFALLTQKFKVTPGNVECLASYISPGATITELDIHFSTEVSGELLLTVPIEKPKSSIIITLGIDSSYPNTHDATLRIGVTDFHNSNWFHIVDAAQYVKSPPCFAVVDNTDETLVSEGTKVPSTLQFTIHPMERFGYCETAQEGGYINVGKLNQKLDLAEPLNLQLIGWNADEEYSIHYILIQSI